MLWAADMGSLEVGSPRTPVRLPNTNVIFWLKAERILDKKKQGMWVETVARLPSLQEQVASDGHFYVWAPSLGERIRIARYSHMARTFKVNGKVLADCECWMLVPLDGLPAPPSRKAPSA